MRKKKPVQVNVVKKDSRITKKGISLNNIISTVSKQQSDTDITEKSTDSILQDIPYLSDDTLKEPFFHLGEGGGYYRASEN